MWSSLWLRALLGIGCAPPRLSQHLPLPDPPYDFDELEPDFDGAVTRRHHREVFGNHVKCFNRVLRHLRHTDAYRKIFHRGGIDDLLRRINEVPSSVRPKLRQHAGGYVNHELFFRTIRPSRGRAEDQQGNAPQEGLLLAALEHSFGSFKAFKDAFSELASQVFGAGWVWLVVDSAVVQPRNGSQAGTSDWAPPHLKIMETEKNDHVLQIAPSHIPLLCLDVWEHAYFGQFYNDRQKYIDAWWNLVNWDEVGDILAAAALSLRLGSEESTAVDEPQPKRAVVARAEAFEEFVMAEVVEDPVDDDDLDGLTDLPEVVGPRWTLPRSVGPAKPQFQDHCASIGAFLTDMQSAIGIGTGFRCEVVQQCPPCRVAVARESTTAGGIVASWPARHVLVPSPDALHRETWRTAGPLDRLATALLVENRRENGTWHNYLEFLHDEFNNVRRSALFWPSSLLDALNATLGLGDLLLGARTHRQVAKLFKAAPQFLSGDGEPQQQLFDAEMHWAVTVALCRGVQDSSSDRRVMLPGSELLLRGDVGAANVALRRTGEVMGDAEDAVAESWQLVATRHVEEGSQLVLDAGAGDLELLSRAWAVFGGNSRGPMLHSESLFGGATAVSLLKEKAEDAPRRWKEQWRDWHCDDELREPRLDHRRSMSFSRGLVMCIAFVIRLLDSSVGSILAPSAVDDSPPPPPYADVAGNSSSGAGAQGGGGASDSERRYSKAEVFYGAYQLVAEACHAAATRYHGAAAIVAKAQEEWASVAAPIGAFPKVSALDREVAAELHKVLVADAGLLDRCVSQAQSRAERQHNLRFRPQRPRGRPRPSQRYGPVSEGTVDVKRHQTSSQEL